MTGVTPVFLVPHAIYSYYRWEDYSELCLFWDNNNIYLLKLGCNPVAVFILHVYKI